jgi:peptidoglycan/LPS O-acetylase OafA/YrhL
MKIQRLEAARGLAAVYVVAQHWIPPGVTLHGLNVGIAFRFGQEAVILFFLLSGFVIHYSHQQQRHRSAVRYYFDRATRIYIPLVSVFVLSYLIQSLIAGRLIDPDILGLTGNVLMLQDIDELKPGVIISPYLGNSPLWSLSYEWWFYMAYFPLIAARMSWRTKSIIVLIFSAAAAVAYLFWPLFPLRVVMYFAIWWCGASLAADYLQKRRIDARDIARVCGPILIISLVLAANVLQFRADWASLRPGFHPILELRHFVSALVIVVGAGVWQSLRWVGFRWLVAPFAFFAPISYGIYIVHVPILQLDVLLEPIWLVVRVAIFIALILATAALLERVVYPAIKTKLRHALFPTGAPR